METYQNGHLPTRALLLAVSAALLGILVLPGCSAFFVAVPISEKHTLSEGGSASNKGFDKVAYVDKIWESKVLPAVKDKAVDFDTLYTAIKLNKDEASAKYGHQVGTPFSFLTKFEGKVKEVNTTSRAGKMTVETQAGGKAVPLVVQIGPVLQGTAIRDAVGFITFNEFVNQLQFADVADELNTRAYNNALKDKQLDSLVGKTVSISGAFSLDDTIDNIQVMPIYMEVK